MASVWTRLAGLSGASAVSLGAYGAHKMHEKKEEYKQIFQTANRYHLLHSATLLAAPLARKPHLVGSCMTGGILLFCGTNYVVAMKEEKGDFGRLAPVGGMLLIAGWLSFIL